MTRKQVSFPVSDKEHEQIKRLAQKNGEPSSSWC